MASKAIYSVLAVIGIAGASGAAYWFQSKPKGPTEITASSQAGAAAGGASAAGGARGTGGGGGPGGPIGVEVAKVEITRLQDDAQSVGSLRSRQNVMVRPEVAGRVLTMGFTDGARVRKGDVIVQLDDVLQRAEVRQSEAQVSIARANLKRNQELVAQSFIAQRVVDESAANVQVVEAQLALSCARWERMRIAAPFDGTAGIRNINIGDYVKDGADLVNIEDLSSMYVDFKLPERFQGKVRREQEVELQLDAMPGRTFKAKIEAIDPQIDANGRAISIRAVMPNTAGEALVQRAGPGGTGAPGAAGPGGRPGAAVAGGAPRPGAAAGQRPAARPPQRPVSAPAASAVQAPRAVDPITSLCAPFSSASRVAAANPSAVQSGAVGAGPGSGARGGAGTGSGASANRPGAGATGAGPGAGAGGMGPLRPGMFARVTTVFSIKDKSITVPEEAIVPQAGRQFVIKVVQQTEEQAKVLAEGVKAAIAKASEEGRAAPPPAPPLTGFVDGKRLVSQRIEVRLGIRRPGRVEIVDGLTEEDTVVIAGQQRLQRDNSPIRIIDLARPGGGGGGQGGQGGGAGGGGIGSASPAGASATASSPAPTTAASSASR